MTTLYLIRHGRSVGNTHGIVSGHLNIGLTLCGLKQAELIDEYFSDKKVDKIYSSDLNRAKKTVAPTAKRHGLDIEITPALREINLGDWEGMLYSEIKELYPTEFENWTHNRTADAKVMGGETFGELYDRMKNAVLKIAEENDGKSVIIGSHALALRAFLCYALGYGKDGYYHSPPLNNGSISIFTFEDGKFTPVGINITSHLGDEIQ